MMKRFGYYLISLFGFGAASCVCAYGTPTTDYTIKGKVADSEGMPIKGIVVSSRSAWSDETSGVEVAVTGEDGSFRTKTLSDNIHGDIIVFTDTDGEANGGDFATIEVDISDLPQQKIKKGKGWYQGEYEVTADVKLDKK